MKTIIISKEITSQLSLIKNNGGYERRIFNNAIGRTRFLYDYFSGKNNTALIAGNFKQNLN